MQIVSLGDNLHEMQNPIFWTNKENYFKVSAAERRVRQHSFAEIDHEIFSMVILSLPLIQEGQLSVSGKRMCASTG